VKHLLYLKELNQGTISRLLTKAESLLMTDNFVSEKHQALRGYTVANLFYEPSTRTRGSFQIAAKKLGADILNFDEKMSSSEKGETILDTIYTLESMGINYFVIRHSEAGMHAMVAKHVKENSHVINAGEADISHPTQGLLDLLTIKQHKKNFDQLKVVIIGDIKHSRVARSLAEGLKIMSVKELTLISPESFKPNLEDYVDANYTSNLDEGLIDADVVMALRIQQERIKNSSEEFVGENYFNNYGLTNQRLASCNDDVIIMHPGPMNRGIEISDNVADGKHSVIREQVTNGISVRMALLSMMQAEVMK
jgi:aspartate carbamoyltransferase catalytic subunit